MSSRFTEEKFDTRKTLKVRLYAHKFMAEKTLLFADKAIEHINNLLEQVKNCYKLEIVEEEEVYNIRTNFATKFLGRNIIPMWVTEEITNAKKIKQSLPYAKFQPEITENVMNVPAIKIRTNTQQIPLSETNTDTTKSIKETTTVTWHELTSDDIVVNKDLKQIYPKAIGRIPMALTEMLQHVR